MTDKTQEVKDKVEALNSNTLNVCRVIHYLYVAKEAIDDGENTDTIKHLIDKAEESFKDIKAKDMQNVDKDMMMFLCLQFKQEDEQEQKGGNYDNA